MDHTLTNIECPNCGHSLKVEEALLHQFKHQFEAQTKAQEQSLAQREAKLRKAELDVGTLVREKLEKERATLKENIQKEIQEAKALELNSYKNRLQKQTAELKQLKTKEVQLLEQKAELDRKQQEMDLNVKRQLLVGKQKIEAEAKKAVQEETYLKLREKDELVEALKRQMDEMKRKAEQGSMQLQGEVQEIALAELLRQQFPFDTIEEVPTGTRGADVLQTVINPQQQACGKIIYESKRTKAFKKEWLSKLKEDMQQKAALIPVLVTEAMPKALNRFGNLEGVWICSFEEAGALAHILRSMLLREAKVRLTQENKGDKMSLLYDYLTGPEFRQQVEAIAEAFSTMQDDLAKEKRAMTSIWKKREKQIQRVIENTYGLYGAVQGIAGKAVQSIPLLELPGEATENP